MKILPDEDQSNGTLMDAQNYINLFLKRCRLWLLVQIQPVQAPPPEAIDELGGALRDGRLPATAARQCECGVLADLVVTSLNFAH